MLRWLVKDNGECQRVGDLVEPIKSCIQYTLFTVDIL